MAAAVAMLRRVDVWVRAEQQRIAVTLRRMDALARAISANPAATPPATLDGWGHPIRFVRVTYPNGVGWVLASPGSDGEYTAETRALLDTPPKDIRGMIAGALAARGDTLIAQPWYEATRADYLWLGPTQIAGYTPGSNPDSGAPPAVWHPLALRFGLPALAALIAAARLWPRQRRS